MDILLVEDEEGISRLLDEALSDAGHRVTVSGNGQQAMSQIDQRAFDLVLTDIRLPGVDGLTIFRRLRQERPDTDVILMSAYGTVSEAVEAIRGKAAHYLAKPFDMDELFGAVNQVVERCHVRRAIAGAREKIDEYRCTENLLIGNTHCMEQLRQRIVALGESQVTVLITGESGVGKELVAKAIHNTSRRRVKPLIAVNCAAFPETLLEAELFGYERGAFTGAFRRRDGRFKAAEGGTLLLDEIGEMTPTAQAKLLRVFAEGTYQPLGTNSSLKADVRVIAATNVDLGQRIQQGYFREDLFYRLKVFTIEVPPLRQRREDIPLLVEYFLRQLTPGSEEPPGISPAAWAAILQHEYPGNVRELKHAIQYALVLSRGSEIECDHLPVEITRERPTGGEDVRGITPLNRAVAQFERQYLLRVLEQVEWSKTRAADALGISRKNLWEKLRRHSISSPISDEPAD